MDQPSPFVARPALALEQRQAARAQLMYLAGGQADVMMAGLAVAQRQSVGGMFRQPLGARAVVGRHQSDRDAIDMKARAHGALGHLQSHADILDLEEFAHGLTQHTDILYQRSPGIRCRKVALQRLTQITDRAAPAHAQRVGTRGLSLDRHLQCRIDAALHHGQTDVRVEDRPQVMCLVTDMPMGRGPWRRREGRR